LVGATDTRSFLEICGSSKKFRKQVRAAAVSSWSQRCECLTDWEALRGGRHRLGRSRGYREKARMVHGLEARHRAKLPASRTARMIGRRLDGPLFKPDQIIEANQAKVRTRWKLGQLQATFERQRIAARHLSSHLRKTGQRGINLPEVGLRNREVRFTPKNRHRQPSLSGPESANS
jgi:hypothetical protein